MADITTGFIGAGNMAASLVRGLLQRGIAAGSIGVADPDTEKLQTLQTHSGIQIGSNAQIAAAAELVVLAVKPQVMRNVCQQLAGVYNDPVFVSVAAGITLQQLQRWLGADRAIVRCMPNTPALVGEGMTGAFASPAVSAQQKEQVQSLLEAVGSCLWVEQETDLDSVTAISGSGPAYFFLFMEAMENAARDQGLSPEQARQLVLQTALGAATLAEQSEDSVAELRRRVTSPGGTTEQAIASFESQGLQDLVNAAVQAARDRAVELARESDHD